MTRINFIYNYSAYSIPNLNTVAKISSFFWHVNLTVLSIYNLWPETCWNIVSSMFYPFMAVQKTVKNYKNLLQPDMTLDCWYINVMYALWDEILPLSLVCYRHDSETFTCIKIFIFIIKLLHSLIRSYSDPTTQLITACLQHNTIAEHFPTNVKLCSTWYLYNYIWQFKV